MTEQLEKPEDKVILEELISLEDAAKLSGLSHGHLALLIRKKKLWGKKIGRNWITTKRAIFDYLASNPQPGPKPREKVL